jgi:DNA (cytosine-5)-methyltransferase 1
MAWDEPAPTITTQCIGLGNGQFGHPEQDRAISLREAALLQTFPRGYRFVDRRAPVSMHTVAMHIGNAVPVRLGRIVARSIKRHLSMCGLELAPTD